MSVLSIPERWAKLYSACSSGGGWDMDAVVMQRLIREIGTAEAMLKRLEWFDENGTKWCAICDSDKARDHAPDCELKRLLKPQLSPATS